MSRSKVRSKTARRSFKRMQSRTNTLNLAPTLAQRGGRRM